jgi:putative cell wall-binding protein/beta-lactamase superfamily II metal-dependent hydrolase
VSHQSSRRDPWLPNLRIFVRRRALLPVLAAALVAPAVVSTPAAAAGDLTVRQLAVGQNEAALFEGPCGEVAILDAGEGSADEISSGLSRLSATSVAWVAISHYHSDHIGDVVDLQVEVPVVYDRGGGASGYSSATYDAYYAYAEARQHVALDIGEQLILCAGADEVTFTVVSAGTDGTAADGVAVTDENDRSLCFLVEYGDFDMATCGDINGTDEGSRTDVESAVADQLGDVEVLKVNHHGSGYSSNTTFVQTVQPNVSIISVGKNTYGHPDPAVVSRLDQAGDVFTTNNPNDGSVVDGDVTVTTSGTSSFTVHTSGEDLTLTYGTDEAGGAMPTEPEPAPGPTPDEPGMKRLAGADRYATAAEIVQDSFPSGPVPVLFVATGEAFADALAGGPAADVLGGPVLPVAKASIPSAIRSELSRLDPARIVILGGPGAVSDAVATELQSYTSGSVTRMAGVNRYDTAAKVAQQVFTEPVPQVLIATGLGFADALAGGAVGALTDSPVLLVDPKGLPAETASALRQLQPGKIAVLGGPAAVSDGVVQQLQDYTTGSVSRLSGDSRYSTAARIVQTYWPQTADVVYLATGRNFPDALAGVPAAGLDQAPLLLTEPDCLPAETKQEIDRLQASTVVVLGGKATVSDAAATGSTICGSSEPPPSEPTPANPGGSKNCSDFSTWREAQDWFEYYYPHYGDVANLDADDDQVACESLPGAP